MNRKPIVIVCPKCNREYLPAEILIPSAFIGKPDIIQRDVSGSITNFTGTTLDNEELYCCDNCNTSFRVTADITFKTEVDEATDFSSDYRTTLSSRFNIKEF